MKVAIIGRGFGAYAMKPAFAAHGWDVELVSSRDGEAVRAACARPFDLISIHSPPFQHREHVLTAIEAGRDVLCDKPFGMNAAEAREMRDAAAAAGALHFVNFEFRFQPARRKAAELLRAGAIGAPRHASFTSFAGFLRERDHGWLNERDRGGGWLGALGSHMIDAMRWYFASEVVDSGGIARVDVRERPDGRGGTARSTAEDAFSIWLAMANGGSASLDAAAAVAAPLPARMEIMGERGAIELIEDRVVRVLRPGEPPEEIDCAPGEGAGVFAALPIWISEIEGSLRERRQIAPNFDDGLAVAEVIDHLRQTMRRT